MISLSAETHFTSALSQSFSLSQQNSIENWANSEEGVIFLTPMIKSFSLVFVEWIRKYENVLDNHGEGSGGGGGGTL